MKMKIIVDGNIGSGKTTQLNQLDKKGFKVNREPVDKWPLELYYSDPERWGLFFQLIVLQSHKPQGGGIYERYPGSGTQVFWPLMTKTSQEDSVYQKAYSRYRWDPDVFIWINTDTDRCWENIKKRNQSGDRGVTLAYIEQLDVQYQKMFKNLECLKFEVNGNQTIEEVHDEILKIINFYYKNE
jgi:deoxyadenosine/deoxycytidine kinase